MTAPASSTAADSARIHKIQRGCWIGYSQAVEIREELERLLAYPQINRMPNIALIGESNSGKSELLNNFYRRHEALPDPNADLMHIPVLKIQAPNESRLESFYEEILAAIFLPPKLHSRESAAEQRRRIVAALRSLGTKMLVVDEAHSMMTGKKTQRLILNGIKYLANELKIPIVLAGTSDLLSLLNSDRQLANRFIPVTLKDWSFGMELGSLLLTLENHINLKHKSDLASEPIQRQILAMSEGLLGEIIDVVKLAAEVAIKSGKEKITVESLRQLNFSPPSRRPRR
ncbi:MAG: TniB family NTP-binding protein [Burkholderiales bacterium]|nr:TniB family NTP-binding protein [Burkholderiales bacterium]